MISGCVLAMIAASSVSAMHCENARETPAVGIADDANILDVYAATPALTDASTGTPTVSIAIAATTAHAVSLTNDVFIISSEW
jgi:hypothetical protein